MHRLALTLLALLWMTPALAEVDASAPAEAAKRPHLTLDLSLGLGSGTSTGASEGQLSFGLHLTARHEQVVLAGNMEGAFNVLASGHGFITGGAGTWVELQGGRLVLVALAGRHFLEVVELFGTNQQHELQVVGARAVLEIDTGRWLMPRAALCASGYVDLEREYDPVVGGDVGGVTALFSVALGLGI